MDRYQIYLKHKVDSLTPAISAGEGRYPRYLLECIDWALEIYPKDRPQSAQELQDGLLGTGRPFKGPKPAISIPAIDERRVNPKRERTFSIGKLVLGLVLLLAIATGAAYVEWPFIKKHYPAQARQVEKLMRKAEPVIYQLRDLVKSR